MSSSPVYARSPCPSEVEIRVAARPEGRNRSPGIYRAPRREEQREPEHSPALFAIGPGRGSGPLLRGVGFLLSAARDSNSPAGLYGQRFGGGSFTLPLTYMGNGECAKFSRSLSERGVLYLPSHLYGKRRPSPPGVPGNVAPPSQRLRRLHLPAGESLPAPSGGRRETLYGERKPVSGPSKGSFSAYPFVKQ